MSSVTVRRGRKARSLFRQIRYQIVLLLRTPSAPFFTLAVPFMLMVTLDLVYGSRRIPGGELTFPQFYLPAMMAFAVVNACWTNIITGTTIARQSGILKRIRCTPLPGWVYLLGRVVSAALIAFVSVTGVALLSLWVSGTQWVWCTTPGTIVTIALGMLCFSLLGLAVTPLITNTDGALPVAYGTILPLAFVSEVFFPADTGPEWLRQIASCFPLKPLAHTLVLNLTPGATGLGFHWRELVVMAGWTLVAVLALHWFRWDPTRYDTRAPRRA
jgi:ABC-2 type transport system permease protein